MWHNIRGWSEGLVVTILLGMNLSADVLKMHSNEAILYLFYGRLIITVN